MNRRSFLHVGSLSLAVVFLPRGMKNRSDARTDRTRAAGTVDLRTPSSDVLRQPVDLGPQAAQPFLELQGGPMRQSCCARAHYTGTSYETMTEDLIHHRLPPEWRERMLLGIREPETS